MNAWRESGTSPDVTDSSVFAATSLVARNTAEPDAVLPAIEKMTDKDTFGMIAFSYYILNASVTRKCCSQPMESTLHFPEQHDAQRWHPQEAVLSMPCRLRHGHIPRLMST